MGRSRRQKAHLSEARIFAHAARRGADKENAEPLEAGASQELLQLTQDARDTAVERAKSYESRFRNERRKVRRAEKKKDSLLRRAESAEAAVSQEHSRAESSTHALAVTSAKLDATVAQNAKLRKEKNASRMRDARAPLTKARAVEKARKEAYEEAEDAAGSSSEFRMMDKGVYTDKSREMVLELVACGVPTERVGPVIEAVAEGMGKTVDKTPVARSVGRFEGEAFVASKMQIVKEVGQVESLTISGDGTSHRHRQFESKHAAYVVSDDPSGSSSGSGPSTTNSIPTQRFFGITSAVNHTSETQLNGWKDEIEEMYALYNDSPSGRKQPMDPRTFAAKIKGLLTDHAEDQKKLARLIKLWKLAAQREIRGEQAIRTRTGMELLPVLYEENEKKLEDAGGLEAWEGLSPEEKDERDVATFHRVCGRVADDELASLSDEDVQDVVFFVWAGCCMHKEMNAVKGGNVRLAASWHAAGLTPPVPLFNRDNAAAAEGGPSAARDRALDRTLGGAVKATSLAGAIFHHKDAKKGQQDTFRIYFESELGYAICFPGTSNIRYQSHCDAAAELLVHLPLYITFLGIVKDKKESRKLNNMEANLLKALQDIPTLTEFAILVLYSQSISIPYLRCVRGSDAEFQNAMDLQDLHERVIAHCKAIVANPDLLLADDASWELGALDGKPWERPDAFYAVHRHMPSFPHLRNGLLAFFEGALETWERFASEYMEGGTIASATESQRAQAFMAPTNDINEGALGSYRVSARNAPNLTLDRHNARAMYKKNNTKAYIRTLDPADRQYLRRASRKMDASGREKKRRREQQDADDLLVEGKRRKDDARRDRADAAAARIDAVELRLDVDDITANPGTGKDIELQLEALRKHDPAIPKKSHLKNKRQRLDALLEAVARYNAPVRNEGDMSGVDEGPVEPSAGWDWEDEEAERSEMEYC